MLKLTDSEQLISQLNCAASATDTISAITAISTSGITDKAVISALIQTLSSYPYVATAAVKALVKLGSETVAPLISAYHASCDQGLQAYIIQALAQIGDARACDLLAEVVGVAVANHCQGNVRRVAARGLGKIGSTTKDTKIIQLAVEKLTWALLTPEDWGLRYAAAVSLREIDTPTAKAALKKAFEQESDQVVRSRITMALD